MSYLILLIQIVYTMHLPVVFDFNEKADLGNWQAINDVVMGGRSSSSFSLDDNGNGMFQGEVSLENNGGFASVRYLCGTLELEGSTKIVIRLRGDGKNYQFRIKADAYDRHAFVAPFSTTGEWQEVTFVLSDMYPTFRGRKLDLGNFSAETIEELRFLIGNKKAESFKLLIDKIELK